MNEEPLVSVIMPVFNTESFVAEAIESILNQTYPHFEFIVVNDGSTDGAVKIIDKYAQQDERVHPVRYPENKGVVAARNEGLELARGDYIAVLDSDDVALEDRLKKEVEFLESNPDYAVIGGQVKIIDEDSKTIGYRRYPTSYEKILAVITRENPLAHSTVLIRKAALDGVGQYNPAYPGCEDYELWLRIAEKHKIANLEDFLVAYRLRKGQFKDASLKRSLWYTQKIQSGWLFKYDFFSFGNVLLFGLRCAIFLLPGSLVRIIFTRLYYAKKPSN